MPIDPVPSLNPVNYPVSNRRKNGAGRCDKWNPAPAEENPGRQEAFNCTSVRNPLRIKKIYEENQPADDFLKVSQEEYNIICKPVVHAKSLKSEIQDHVARRAALFFQQAVVCYNTPFHYEIAKTEGQYFTAPAVKIESPKGERYVSKEQAAHPSTLPGLDATLRTDWKQKGANAVYFSYLKNSHLDIQCNSTSALPTFLNQIDTLIDGRSSNTNPKKGLRASTIKLINKVAKKALSPMEATRQFLENMSEMIQERRKASKRITPEKEVVLQIFQKKVNEMTACAKKHRFFDGLIDVNVTGEEGKDVALIRKIVYEKKYKIIREAQFTEAQIQRVIDQQTAGKSKDERHFFCLALTYSAGSSSIGDALKRLFCISVDDIEENAALERKIKKFIKENKVILENALRDIRLLIHSFQKIEQCFQATLLCDFRKKLRDMTQKELSSEMKRIIEDQIEEEESKAKPNKKRIQDLARSPVSAPTICRYENSKDDILKQYKTNENQRRKLLTVDQAKIISEALNVQIGHFFCSYFASREFV